jgi:hypothetical protein
MDLEGKFRAKQKEVLRYVIWKVSVISAEIGYGSQQWQELTLNGSVPSIHICIG